MESEASITTLAEGSFHSLLLCVGTYREGRCLQPDRVSFPSGSRAQDSRGELNLACLRAPILRQRSDRLVKYCAQCSDGLGVVCSCSGGHICRPATDLPASLCVPAHARV